jgi:acyl-CoA thioester hydrolase
VTARLRIEPRWTDLDPLGHVNNSVYLVYAEEARARYLRGVLPAVWEMIVVVNNTIDYHSPADATDTLEITSAIDAVGTSSFTTVSHIAAVDGRRCATVRTVQVVLREDRGGTRPWTESERASLAELVGARAD